MKNINHPFNSFCILHHSGSRAFSVLKLAIFILAIDFSDFSQFCDVAHNLCINVKGGFIIFNTY